MNNLFEPMDIAVRAFACAAEKQTAKEQSNTSAKKRTLKREPIASDWTLIFDTETTVNSSLRLRFGTYQVRKSEELIEKGVFYDPDTLALSEQKLLDHYAKTHALDCLTVDDFIEKYFTG